MTNQVFFKFHVDYFFFFATLLSKFFKAFINVQYVTENRLNLKEFGSNIPLTAPLSQPLLTFVSAMAVTRGKISPMAVTKAICLEFGFYYSHN